MCRWFDSALGHPPFETGLANAQLTRRSWRYHRLMHWLRRLQIKRSHVAIFDRVMLVLLLGSVTAAAWSAAAPMSHDNDIVARGRRSLSGDFVERSDRGRAEGARALGWRAALPQKIATRPPRTAYERFYGGSVKPRHVGSGEALRHRLYRRDEI